MTTVQTWIQEDFKTPNQEIYRKPGDFLSIDNLIPSIDGKRLERVPTWTGHIHLVTDFSAPTAAFYDQSDKRFGFMGTSTELEPGVGTFVGTMLIEHDDLSTLGIYTMGTNMGEALGGNHKQNAFNIMGSFWFIDEDGNVFEADDPYASSVTKRYIAADHSNDEAISLIPIRDQLFLVTDADVVRYHDPDLVAGTPNDTFASYFTPTMNLNIKNAFHFREDIVLFAGHDDGSLMIYQLPATAPATLRELIRLPAETGLYLPDSGSAQYGTPFCIHQDRLYFSPGIYWSDASDCEITPIWSYDGNSVELVKNVEAPIVPTAWGLVEWRGRLILYFINASAQHLYLLHGGRFVQFNDDTLTVPSHGDLYCIGGEIWLPTEDAQSNEGWTRLDDYATGTFTSSWLDMGHPASQKHLSRLACVISGPASDFNVKIEYRTEAGSWTEAVEEDNARHVDAGNLGVTFYLLQIRITFTDSTGNDEAVKLESLAATYSYGVR